jgi:hypothetical protein
MAFPTSRPVTAGKPAFILICGQPLRPYILAETLSWSPVTTTAALILSFLTWKLYGSFCWALSFRSRSHGNCTDFQGNLITLDPYGALLNGPRELSLICVRPCKTLIRPVPDQRPTTDGSPARQNRSSWAFLPQCTIRAALFPGITCRKHQEQVSKATKAR